MIVEKVREEMQEFLDYYQRKNDELIENEPAMLELAELLDSLFVKHVTIGSASISVAMESIPEARFLLSQILEKTTIDKFIKISQHSGDGLSWGFSVNYKGINLTIFPAEPSKDCIVVKKTNTYISWVCEKRE